MRTVLIVVSDFPGYAKGAEITDPKEIKAVLESESHVNVVTTQRDDEKKADTR